MATFFRRTKRVKSLIFDTFSTLSVSYLRETGWNPAIIDRFCCKRAYMSDCPFLCPFHCHIPEQSESSCGVVDQYMGCCADQPASLLHTIHDNTDHHFFFFRSRFRDHNRKRHQCPIFYLLLSIRKQRFVFVQKIQKHRRRNSFVPVKEAVIFRDKVQKVCCFFFQRLINISLCQRIDKYFRCCP